MDTHIVAGQVAEGQEYIPVCRHYSREMLLQDFFPSLFFPDSQCLATTGAETPGGMNICYKGV